MRPIIDLCSSCSFRLFIALSLILSKYSLRGDFSLKAVRCFLLFSKDYSYFFLESISLVLSSQ